MKFEELAAMPAKELNKRSKELRQQLFQARLKNTLGQLSNPMEIREMRRSIARLKTAAAVQAAAPKKTAKRATKAKAKG